MKLFELGKITMTPTAISIIAKFKVPIGDFLDRHERGDYGDVSEKDWRENTMALLPDSVERVMSVYSVGNTAKIWIITDPDRKVTTLLTEEDF